MTWLKHKGKYFNINENKWKSVRGHDCEGGSMSKTPRTDEHLRMKEKNGHVAIVSRDFARQLETELADKEKQLAEAWAEIERLKRTGRN